MKYVLKIVSSIRTFTPSFAEGFYKPVDASLFTGRRRTKIIEERRQVSLRSIMALMAFVHFQFPGKISSQRLSSSYSALRRMRHVQPSIRRVAIRCCDTAAAESEHEPVEDVTLPPVTGETLETHVSWLQIEVCSWLDAEWPEKEAVAAHREIAVRTAQLYGRLRAEAINDLSDILLGIGGGLEGSDFSKTYTGPWNVANRTAELLLERFAPERLLLEDDKPRPDEGKVQWSVLDETERLEVPEEPRRPASPSLADEFERYRFLQMVLDGSASKAVRLLLQPLMEHMQCIQLACKIAPY